jgi:hypothetical protein
MAFHKKLSEKGYSAAPFGATAPQSNIKILIFKIYIISLKVLI